MGLAPTNSDVYTTMNYLSVHFGFQLLRGQEFGLCDRPALCLEIPVPSCEILLTDLGDLEKNSLQGQKQSVLQVHFLTHHMC